MMVVSQVLSAGLKYVERWVGVGAFRAECRRRSAFETGGERCQWSSGAESRRETLTIASMGSSAYTERLGVRVAAVANRAVAAGMTTR